MNKIECNMLEMGKKTDLVSTEAGQFILLTNMWPA